MTRFRFVIRSLWSSTSDGSKSARTNLTANEFICRGHGRCFSYGTNNNNNNNKNREVATKIFPHLKIPTYNDACELWKCMDERPSSLLSTFVLPSSTTKKEEDDEKENINGNPNRSIYQEQLFQRYTQDWTKNERWSKQHSTAFPELNDPSLQVPSSSSSSPLGLWARGKQPGSLGR